MPQRIKVWQCVPDVQMESAVMNVPIAISWTLWNPTKQIHPLGLILVMLVLPDVQLVNSTLNPVVNVQIQILLAPIQPNGQLGPWTLESSSALKVNSEIPTIHPDVNLVLIPDLLVQLPDVWIVLLLKVVQLLIQLTQMLIFNSVAVLASWVMILLWLVLVHPKIPAKQMRLSHVIQEKTQLVNFIFKVLFFLANPEGFAVDSTRGWFFNTESNKCEQCTDANCFKCSSSGSCDMCAA